MCLCVPDTNSWHWRGGDEAALEVLGLFAVPGSLSNLNLP